MDTEKKALADAVYRAAAVLTKALDNAAEGGVCGEVVVNEYRRIQDAYPVPRVTVKLFVPI